MATILYVDDEPSVGSIIEDTLERAGHKPVGARSVPEALQVLARGGVDLIVSDYRMPGVTGLEFLNLLQRDGSDVPVIMLTGYGSIEHAVASIKAGAVDYITKPIRPAQFELAVNQALEFVRLRRENEALRREVMEFRNERQIIGDSPAMRRIMQTVSMAAPTRATVLLQGESGTGKELFARAVHNQSDRSNRPFIQLNCAALPEGLIESALFGHERGAFTGAIKRVEGAFERAHRGTLLLDEISEMRLDLQAKLLRVLQEQEFERVGGTTPIRVDVRVIATTNRDLAREAEAGTFRRDLFFRLGVIPILIPPLRDRVEDIPLLAMRFAEKTAAELGKDIRGISTEAMQFIQSQEWPGNVRELQHAVERAVIFTTDSIVPLHAFDSVRYGLATRPATPRPPAVREVPRAATPHSAVAHPASLAPDAAAADGPANPILALDTLNIADVERALIAKALEMSGGHRSKAANLLGMSVRTLRHKLNTPSSSDVIAADEEL
ncbi:MAG TPA: sigma-54 dependent transcriptional regulator [Gemmatimonadaceae bacterium]|nr:sigma-54 dependent transcriptional regulator [Gemmatimonadaceae bacterium]